MPDKTPAADLEIGLHRRTAGDYSVELRFNQSTSAAEVRYDGTATFDLEQLQQQRLDPLAYGRLLSEQLFTDVGLLQHVAEAYSMAHAHNAPLRVRLFIGPSATELHHLRWETVRHPKDMQRPLVTDQNILFSRYLSSEDGKPVHVPGRPDLRSLVVIANPTNLQKYAPGGETLAPLDVPRELAQAEQGLQDIPPTSLSTPGSATLNTITRHLNDGYHILYLVAHGALLKDGPKLWLERTDGQADVVDSNALVTRIAELQQRPLLVVLASCASAGGDAGNALLALGPQLARAGIPAVLAMQGNISMETIATFMPAFFQELQQDGQIDRAVAVARGHVRERHDWWMPSLFMRVHNGRLWESDKPKKESDSTLHIGEHTVQVFLSYAPDDKKPVEQYYQQLADAGLKPWMASKDMLGGQVREAVIRERIRESDFLLVFLTERAVSKPGPFHKALRQALDVWQEKPEGHIYLIPVRLEDCTIPTSLQPFETIDLFEEGGWEQLQQTFQFGIERLYPGQQ